MHLGSRIGLGTAPLGSTEDGPLWWGPQDRSTAVATVRAALDAGITWVDTAPFYGWGRAEEIVGEAVRGRRDEVTILTKCGTVRRPDGSWADDGSPAAIRADLEASLTRLGTDRVDVLQLHDPDPDVAVEESVGAMADLVAEGKVRHVGLSNHDVDLLVRGAAVAPIAAVQHQWSILHHPPEADAARRWCEERDARFLGWSPLASGFLVDGFDPEATAAGDLRRRLPWATGDGARRLAEVRAEAAAAGRSVRDHALAWASATSYPSSAPARRTRRGRSPCRRPERRRAAPDQRTAWVLSADVYAASIAVGRSTRSSAISVPLGSRRTAAGPSGVPNPCASTVHPPLGQRRDHVVQVVDRVDGQDRAGGAVVGQEHRRPGAEVDRGDVGPEVLEAPSQPCAGHQQPRLDVPTGVRRADVQVAQLHRNRA